MNKEFLKLKYLTDTINNDIIKENDIEFESLSLFLINKLIIHICKSV